MQSEEGSPAAWESTGSALQEESAVTAYQEKRMDLQGSPHLAPPLVGQVELKHLSGLQAFQHQGWG